MKTQTKMTPVADIGDFMKISACTAVMLQTVLALALTTNPNHATQLLIGVFYDLVKFTAPAFIFGILYTTTRTTFPSYLPDYPKYLRRQWSALVVPTIWWTLIYLIIFPGMQQMTPYHNCLSFLWQFVNGNAAPHLWYNTMMLQFILLMPLFWALARWVTGHRYRATMVTGLTLLGYTTWLWFYDTNVWHGPQAQSWYLLDRLFISFLIYGIFGVLAWTQRHTINALIHHCRWWLLAGYLAAFYWTNRTLFQFGFPIKLTNAPYYQPAMTLYALIVIGLIIALANHQIKKSATSLPVIHWLATYAYRAYLANVFWLQVVWRGLTHHFSQQPLLMIITSYILTWGLSFASAYGFHWLRTHFKTWHQSRHATNVRN
ncbi:hypothetical protein C5Z25_10030 [Lactobacillus sp. CBA3605]|uniref:acyltransferase family protein n=1 Tax=Lactobacillus sp. CBA3605 TaxID=2099788 RepID=UPI000CFC48F5|nr:acyltransferase family protein [Lactobacillus sp. CBA3605]AVK62091.1 hypothetical protein C5Z25_10030 [Lactobacillus sp. CBA3605]